MKSIKKIVCPIDFSDRSYKALEAAKNLALKYSAELYLVNVVPPVQLIMPVEESKYELREKNMLTEAHRLLRKTIKSIASEQLRAHSTVVRGSAAQRIIKIAAERHADVIVIGKHRRKGLGHLIFGSIAEKVARHAPCPVLVI